MTVYFTHPGFLWCAAALAVVVWLACRRSALDFSAARTATLVVSRVAIVLAIVLAASGLTLGIASKRREAIFLIDASASVDEKEAARQVEDFIDGVTSLDANVKTKKFYFASRVANEASELSATDKNATDLESALLTALATADPTRSTQIVLFSDGVETTGDARKIAAEQGVAISTSPLTISQKPETQVAEIVAPKQVREGEPFRVEAIVRSAVETSGKISFYRNGGLIENREVALQIGENVFECDIAPQPGAKEIETSAILETKEDTLAENNVASTIVVAEGKPRLLAIADEPTNLRNFATALRSQDVQVETRPLEGLPDDVAELDAFDAVVFSDVSATDLTLRQMEAIRSYARDFGGGFIALGGDSSFSLGGYAKSPLDDVLPLRSDFEKEKEKPSLAISLVIDRSGSMEGDKLELTKDAAKGVVALLSPRDFISVIAFDDAPREVVPLQQAASPSIISETIGAVVASGATNIYAALNQAVDDLSRVNAKFKHIILLTDGKSAPGDYEKTIRRAVDAEISVSAVGIGDCDRFLLEKLAADGAGRFYHCNDPRAVPQIFARETKLADRSALNEEPFLPTPEVGGLKMLAGIDFETAPPLLGNVVAKPKTTSEVVLTTETGEPLLAHWRYGLGVAVAFTSDVDGRWSAEWFDWPEFSQFWAQVARFAMRPNNSTADLTVDVKEDATSVRFDLRDPFDRFFNGAETKTVVVDESRNRVELSTPQRAPGIYEVSFPTRPGVKYALQTTSFVDGERVASRSRVFVAPKGREGDVAPVNEKLLREIAEKSGGSYAPSPEEIAKAFDLREDAKVSYSARGILLAFALLTFVADVYLRRLTSYKIND